MELWGKIGADICGTTDVDLDARLGVRALLAEGAADGLGDDAVVSPDLGREEAADDARDGARDKPLDVIVARD